MNIDFSFTPHDSEHHLAKIAVHFLGYFHSPNRVCRVLFLSPENPQRYWDLNQHRKIILCTRKNKTPPIPYLPRPSDLLTEKRSFVVWDSILEKVLFQGRMKIRGSDEG